MQEKDLTHLSNKERFITGVINDEIIIVKRKQETIINELREKKFDEDTNGGYNYLLSMQLKILTEEKIEELQNEIKTLQAKLDLIIATSEQNMWLQELDDLEKHYEVWLKDINNRVTKTKK